MATYRAATSHIGRVGWEESSVVAVFGGGTCLDLTGERDLLTKFAESLPGPHGYRYQPASFSRIYTLKRFPQMPSCAAR